MKPQALLTWIVAALLGVAGGYFGQSLNSTPGAAASARSLGPGQSVGSSSGIDAAAIEPLKRRLVALEQEGALSDERLAALEGRPVGEGRSPVASDTIPEDMLAGLRDELDMLKRLNNPEAPLPANFRTRVAEAMQLEKEAEDRERDEQRRVSREERMEERMNDLATELGLTVNQKDGMRQVLLNQEDKRSTLFSQARESGDFGSMRQTMRDLRDETNQALAQVLSPDQMQKYEESGGNNFGPGGRGGGRGDAGGGRRGR